MLSSISRKLLHISKSVIHNRNIQSSLRRSGRAYEGDGKTVVTVLNKEVDLGLMINGFSEVGFRLNNEVTVLGPMVIFPKTVLSWNVKDKDDITEASLSLFTVLEPKLDLLILGIGDYSQDRDFYSRLFPFTHKYKISLEILATETACSTFNFLSSEGRCVAAALIPPKKINVTEDDELRSKLRYQNLYKIEE